MLANLAKLANFSKLANITFKTMLANLVNNNYYVKVGEQ